MPSFQISITPSRRAAARFVSDVRRELLRALEEEGMARDLKQTDVARAIGVHRSVINRELRGKKDITLGRLAELAWAMGRRAAFSLPKQAVQPLSNLREFCGHMETCASLPCDCIERIVDAALRAATPAWRPIETAPKPKENDNSWIIGYTSWGQHVGKFHEWVGPCEWFFDHYEFRNAEDFDVFSLPTHWQPWPAPRGPLPAPPMGGKREE